MIVLLLLFFSPLFSQEPPRTSLDFRYNAPYNIDFGASTQFDRAKVYAPYLGLGILPTRTSISWFVYSGISVSRGVFNWDIGYFHAFIPDLQLFDYKNIENYAKTDFTWKWKHVQLRLRASVGRLLYVKNVPPTPSLIDDTAVVPAVRQSIGLRIWLYQGSITKASLAADIGGEHILMERQNSWFVRGALPVTFSFNHGKLALMASFFTAGYWPGAKIYQIGFRYLGYDQAVLLSEKNPTSLYNVFYPITASFGVAYRLYTFGAPPPYNRFYAAVTADVGFGITDTGLARLHYIAGFALGYEYKDRSPFEFRFGFDQERNVFFHFNVVSPLRHRFY
ncbi:MAG: hypothetical protein ACRCY4_04325 [Brevinema sp.]